MESEREGVPSIISNPRAVEMTGLFPDMSLDLQALHFLGRIISKGCGLGPLGFGFLRGRILRELLGERQEFGGPGNVLAQRLGNDEALCGR